MNKESLEEKNEREWLEFRKDNPHLYDKPYPPLTMEQFLDKNEEDLYCAYMETGCYYDMEREDFDERAYEDYIQEWENEGGKPQSIKV